jgi:enoyl-[acyl-carrier protein] reductase III
MPMIELEKMAPNSEVECDGRCEVRLLQTLQKAIGDILSDHARSMAGNARSSLQAPVVGNGPELEPAVERSMRPTNGNSLQLDEQAGSLAGVVAQAGSNASVHVPARAEIATMVVDTIAEITRYPREILTPEARFDDDLGIDSLKRAEIVTALLSRFGEAPSDLKAGPMPLTVGEMTDFAVAYASRSGVTPPRSQPATSDSNVCLGASDSWEPFADASVSPTSSVNAAAEVPRPISLSARNIDRLFEGRVALVTGSGEGLGKIIARQMAELGANVIINSSHSREHGEKTSQEILAGNRQATHVGGSFASSEHVERAFREIEQRFGRLDYYVHNAADEVITSLDRVTESHWEKVFRTHIVAYHLCAMRAAKLMQKSGGGRIVALSSPGAKRYMEHYGVMGTVKAALESLTMYLAQELGPYNVQVNAVAACPIYAEQLNSFPDNNSIVSYRETPEEISEAVIFLLTRAARKINGSTMVIDGGWSQRI